MIFILQVCDLYLDKISDTCAMVQIVLDDYQDLISTPTFAAGCLPLRSYSELMEFDQKLRDEPGFRSSFVSTKAFYTHVLDRFRVYWLSRLDLLASMSFSFPFRHDTWEDYERAVPSLQFTTWLALLLLMALHAFIVDKEKGLLQSWHSLIPNYVKSFYVSSGFLVRNVTEKFDIHEDWFHFLCRWSCDHVPFCSITSILNVCEPKNISDGYERAL